MQSLALALMKRKILLAKNKCERHTQPLKFIGWISLSRTASSNLIDNLSKQRINSYGVEKVTLSDAPIWHHFQERGPIPKNVKPGGGDHIHDKCNEVWWHLKKF